MFNPHNRRYTGAKTKLLAHIDSALIHCFDYTKKSDLRFFDVFAGTGVVSHYFMQKPEFKQFYINDFLYANFVIYQGFFAKESFSQEKLDSIRQEFLELDSAMLGENYYSLHFSGTFFSHNDCKLMGYIREKIQELLHTKAINQKEYFILLASLLYSVDKVANTVGHYDAYRKKSMLKDRLQFELIKPYVNPHIHTEIYQQDSNTLAKLLRAQNTKLDIAFIDPPYNSRQYSRFYHFLDTLAKNHSPKLYGIALKPKPENLSLYCTARAEEAFKDLVANLSNIARILVVTYNNTYNSKSSSSANKISLQALQNILESSGKTTLFTFPHTPFSSGKTDRKTSFKEHKECVFVCEIKQKPS